MAKVLYDELKKHIVRPKSQINNNIEFKKLLDNISIQPDDVLLSLDVCSLFTNISCESVINSLERRLQHLSNCSLPFQEIIRSVKFLFENTFFQFNDKIYQQIFGSPMGLPISPLFADIVMDDLETDCLYELKNIYNIEPTLYKRYVDDTFLIIKKQDITTTLQVFNNKNYHLKFTHEIEINNRINFLDLTIIKHNDQLITNWYQKPTQSNRTLNFNSNHTVQQKKNIIYNLVDRAILLSHANFHQENLRIVKQILCENDYPLQFIATNVKKRLFKIRSIHTESNTYQSSSNTISKRQLPLSQISIPYNKSIFIQFTAFFKKLNIRIIPLMNKKLSSIIKLGKDISDKWESTEVVYTFSCKDCSACYIGETKRALIKRINEHRTSKKIDSVVNMHMQLLDHEFNWDNVKILDREPNYYKRLISEMIYIHCNSNTINRKEDVNLLSSVYKSLFKNIS